MEPKAEAPKKEPAKPAAKPAEAKKDEEMKDAVAEEAPKEPEAPKEAEAPKELEEDAPAISGTQLEAGIVSFNTEDTTLNVMPTAGGKLLMALSEGGLQYLLAGAKANVGLKDGRYMYETMITETKTLVEPPGKFQGPKPRVLVRVGVAIAAAPLLLADSNQNVYFDSEGHFVHGKDKKKVSTKFGAGQVVALVINVDKSSPNAHTLSLFVDGVRASPPQPVPDVLKGKVLYPAVTFRNVTLQVNFGPSLLRPLPFKCHPLAVAAKTDCQVKPKVTSGKHEVIFPVSMPDQGGFDWLDQFLAKNRSYVELSDRAIVAWAAKSGISRVKGQVTTSNDKPEMNYGLPLIDDYSIHKAVWAVAPVLSRNYIVMEVKGNLLADERKKALASFPSDEFKRSAKVIVGEPSEDFKAIARTALLKKKEAKALEERKKQKAQKNKEAERQRLLEMKKKRALDAKKMKEDGEKRAAGLDVTEEAKEDGDNGKEEEKEPEPEEEEAPKVELTPEEEKMWFVAKPTPDLTPSNLSKFTKFCFPVADEGFDEVSFEWSSQDDATKHLKDWMREKKLTQKVEDLQPGEFFKEQLSAWQKQLTAWKKKQIDFKDPAKKKLAAKKKEEEKKKKAEEKADGEEDGEAEPAEEPMEIDPEDLDVFAVEDVMDIGNGEPLFSKFVYQDWALLSLRFELHLLAHAFRRDLDDPERPTFHESHLAFYYKLYFKKDFSTKSFACATVAELFELVKDTVSLEEKSSTVKVELLDDTPLDNFVKLTEEHRRDRARRVDAGDESAELKFTRPAKEAPRPLVAQPQPPATAPPGRSLYTGAARQPSSAPPASQRPAPSAPTRAGSGSGTQRVGGYGGPGPVKRPLPAGSSPYPSATRPRTSSAYGGPVAPGPIGRGPTASYAASPYAGSARPSAVGRGPYTGGSAYR